MSRRQYNQGLTNALDSPALAGATVSIDGIDTAAGLRRVGGNPANYARLLQLFCDTHAGAALKLIAALGNGERDGAERIAHTIHGVAANLGALTLSAAAAALERAIAAQHEDDALINTFAVELAGTTAAIRAACGSPAPAQPGAAAAHASAAAPAAITGALADDLIAGLAALLGEHSGEAVDYLEQHAGPLRAGLGSAAHEALAQAINRFDYAAALQVLGARA